MKKLPVYNWNAEKGIATCILTDSQGRTFTGTAHIHPTDIDFMSEKTGYTIAEVRAQIACLQSAKRDELQPQLAALKQLYYSMNRSKNFNPKSYEATMLFRQIRLKEDDLAAVNEEIATYKRYLIYYINTKDALYKQLRDRRNATVGISD